MHAAVRIGLVVLGAAIVVYGAASLTGGWLGAPPWWERELTSQERIESPPPWRVVRPEPGDECYSSLTFIFFPPTHGPREGREWISGGVEGAGLALVAVGAWPRRRGRGGAPASATTNSPEGAPPS